jgi:hypothetical protein
LRVVGDEPDIFDRQERLLVSGHATNSRSTISPFGILRPSYSQYSGYSNDHSLTASASISGPGINNNSLQIYDERKDDVLLWLTTPDSPEFASASTAPAPAKDPMANDTLPALAGTRILDRDID